MSANPHKVGDRVTHNGVRGTVIEVGSSVSMERVLIERDFNGSHYWDHFNYWELEQDK